MLLLGSIVIVSFAIFDIFKNTSPAAADINHTCFVCGSVMFQQCLSSVSQHYLTTDSTGCPIAVQCKVRIQNYVLIVDGYEIQHNSGGNNFNSFEIMRRNSCL